MHATEHACPPFLVRSVIGMSSAIETFAGQAFGAKRYRAVGVTLQRALWLTLLTCALPIGLWTHVELIMTHVLRECPLPARMCMHACMHALSAGVRVRVRPLLPWRL